MHKTILISITILIILLGAAFIFRSSIVGFLHSSHAPQTATATQADVTDSPVAKNGKKVLVAYFSWGGNTRKTAFRIHEEIGGNIMEIKPARNYPDAYKETTEAAKKEISGNARPAITTKVDDITQYDVILIGYPIWWGTVPPPVRTFLESFDLAGKTILPFATSGGGSMDGSIADLHASAPGAIIKEGLLANTPGVIAPWLKKNELM